MYTQELTQPDGRHLTLYSTRPIPGGLQAPSPFADPQEVKSHLRWHPLRGEWVTYAAYRQNRSDRPARRCNPLAPAGDATHPTELPTGDYAVAVFDNRFPSLALDAHEPPALDVPTAPANGQCKVVVFTQDAAGALGRLPLARIGLLLQAGADRTRRVEGRHHIRYVLPETTAYELQQVEVGLEPDREAA